MLRVGTSGYSYKEWKGTFYPEDLPAARMLPFYATHFSTVEINNTFYRMPDSKTMLKWSSEVPEDFSFVLKAPQRITHHQKLLGSAADVQHFFEVAAELGPKLGPVLFQLPPFLRKDVQRLHDFVNALPEGRRAAFEFRHESWFDETVYSVLRERDLALCAAETDDDPQAHDPIVTTASWGYLRLRRTEYTDAELAAWARRVAEKPWNDAYVFFKHEDEGKGPEFARRFLAACER